MIVTVQTHQTIRTADIGVGTNRPSKHRQIVAVLQKLPANRMIRHCSAFQLDIQDLAILNLKKVKFFSKPRNLKRIEKAQQRHFLHMCFQLIHQHSHAPDLPVAYLQKGISSGELMLHFLQLIAALISCECIDRYRFHVSASFTSACLKNTFCNWLLLLFPSISLKKGAN